MSLARVRDESSYPDLFGAFSKPDPRFSPVAIWWWSGEPLRVDRLLWQMDQMLDTGIYNFLPVQLAPTGPMFGAGADDPILFSDEWWQVWERLCEHASNRGGHFWFYDQIGFSGANIAGRLVAEEPRLIGEEIKRVVVEADGPCRVECPPYGAPVAAYSLSMDETGRIKGPPQPLVISGREVRWSPSLGPRYPHNRVVMAYRVRRGFDYTSEEACAKLIASIHGEYERRLGPYLGTVIVGSFQDELPTLPTWSSTFAEEFAEHAGYRIEPVVGALWEDWGDESAQVRVDYQTIRARLSEAAFFRPLREWHDQHGMTVGFDQQSPSRSGEPIGTVRQYADYMATHRWYSAPGSDHWGDAKIHSSLSHLYGGSRTIVEAFHSTGWGGTLEETFDWLVPWLLAGVDLYAPHAVYYSTRGGMWEWAPPSTCWRQPYWRHYRFFADAVARLCSIMSEGKHVCDVGVLFPTTAVQAGTTIDGPLEDARSAHETYLGCVGRMAWFYAVPGKVRQAGRDFDVLDDDTVANGAIHDGALQVGGESFTVLVIPSCRVLRRDVAIRLIEFADAGGRLVFAGDLPSSVLHDDGEVLKILHDQVRTGPAFHVSDEEDLADLLQPTSSPVRLVGASLHRMVGQTHVLMVPASPAGSATRQPILPWIGEMTEIEGSLLERYMADLARVGYDFQPDLLREHAIVEISGSPEDIELWDPLTGSCSRPAWKAIDGGLAVSVSFSESPVAILIWRQGSGSESDVALGSEEFEEWREVELEGPWVTDLAPSTWEGDESLSTVSVGDHRYVKQYSLASRSVQSNGDEIPSLDQIDDEIWESVVVGQCAWGWIFGPSLKADLPPPLPTGHRGPIHDDRWKPITYSLSSGIHKDPIHDRTLGPKGRVPEEFWHVDDVAPGYAVVLRTAIPTREAKRSHLAIGCNGIKDVWWNGTPLPRDPGGYLRIDEIDCSAGYNTLEVRLTSETHGALRGYWALTDEPELFRRPDWITPGSACSPGSVVEARRSFHVPRSARSATLQLGTRGGAKLIVNGETVGIQGDNEPYGGDLRVLTYDLTGTIDAGDNELVIVVDEGDEPPAVHVDMRIDLDSGDAIGVVSDDAWMLTRNGKTDVVVRERSHPYDPSWELLYPRPHPLPRADSLHEVESSGVMDLVPDPWPGSPRPRQWFMTVVPPGATTVDLPVAAGTIHAWLDGEALRASGKSLVLPRPQEDRRRLILAVDPIDGRRGGGLWDGPLSFSVSQGQMTLGDWADHGLGSYSGSVIYRRTISIDDTPATAQLDLGSVRGTAEVSVNGNYVGTRIWSPYRLDLEDRLHAGTNDIEILVTNTLAPYLDAVSPTRMVFRGQRRSGLFGPVRLKLNRSK